MKKNVILLMISIGVSFGSLCKAKLTLSMIMKNEANNYLRTVLESHKHYIDEAVIIDDGSTDDSVEICKEILKGIPLKIIINDKSEFSNEVILRKKQWEETIKTNPDWILNLDADEIFEDKFRFEIQDLIENQDVQVYYFRLYDFWNETSYRDDKYWCAHYYYRPFLVRYNKNFVYTWHEVPQHCGRFPKNILELPGKCSELRLKHYGWAKYENRLKKYDRYKALDPNALYGWKEQYESILDKYPHLVEWAE